MTNKVAPLIALIVTFFLTACSKEEAQKANYPWPIIKGFPKPQVPNDNPMSIAKVSLGRALFYDNNLSANQQQSCATCHIQKYAFAEPLVVSIGSTGEKLRRNAPALVNIAYNKTLTWAHDGLTSIEQQLLLPMFGENPVELGITNHEVEVLQRFNTLQYQALFQQAFPEYYQFKKSVFVKGSTEKNTMVKSGSESLDLIKLDHISKALASFVRSLISLQSPFDDYAYAANDDAISAAALRGMNLFFSEKLECHHCHGGFNFTQSTSHEKQLIDRRPFHNTGLYNVKPNINIDIGLAEISTLAEDNGRFRAPTLRNIAVSAPYMHDGSIATLTEVLDFYAAGGRNITEGKYKGDGRKNPLKSQFVKGFDMTEQDKADLLAFLHTLTDKRFLTNPEFAMPNSN